MNVYKAIMKAADHIERNPHDFKFTQAQAPDRCGSPGCALGWIGFFYGLDRIDFGNTFRGNVRRVSSQLLGLDWPDHIGHPFYKRMDTIESSWKEDATACARALRIYADKHHSADSEKDSEAFKRFLATALDAETCSAQHMESQK